MKETKIVSREELNRKRIAWLMIFLGVLFLGVLLILYEVFII